MLYLIGSLSILAIIFLANKTESIGGSMVYDDLFKKYANIYGLDWKMLKAIAIVESDQGRDGSVKRGLENPSDIEGSKSRDGLSWGLMQVTLTTARDYDSAASAQKLNNPEYSVRIASQHLARLKKIFSATDPRFNEWVVKSYNQGQGNTLKEMKSTSTTSYQAARNYWLKYMNAYSSIEGI